VSDQKTLAERSDRELALLALAYFRLLNRTDLDAAQQLAVTYGAERIAAEIRRRETGRPG
jgi:hypothetical protein